MRAVAAIAAVELRRFLRDRSNIFFVFIFPLLLVGVIGSQFGDSASRGLVAVDAPPGDLRTALVDTLEAADVTVELSPADEARDRLARGRLDLTIRADRDAGRRFVDGRPLDLEVTVGSRTSAPVTEQRVRAAVASIDSERRRITALTDAGVARPDAVVALDAAAKDVSRPTVREVEDELSREFAGVTGVQVGAVGQTLLFVFLASLSGSATLIQARKLGVVRRTLAAPVSTGQVVVGEALGRLAIAVFQGFYIIVATLLLFGVEWGSLPIALVVVTVFSLVAAGGAMVIGSLLDDDAAASGIGVGVGLVAAALGGCMLPIELFPDTLKTVAKVTPHAWAHAALSDVQRHGDGLVDVLPEIAVLAAMAVAVLAAGATTLRRSLARAL